MKDFGYLFPAIKFNFDLQFTQNAATYCMMWLAVQYSVTAAKLTPAILLLTSMVVTAQSYTNLLGILW